tara:strand:+ start:4117 stop:4470 length:354 start_codon:yes stop_codon:yes gene_type:complete
MPTDEILRPTAPYKSVLESVSVICDTTTSSSSGSNNWQFDVYKGNPASAVSVLAGSKTTNGSEITAYTSYDLGAVHSTNKYLSANDVLVVRVTKNGSPTSLSSANLHFSAEIKKDLG